MLGHAATGILQPGQSVVTFFGSARPLNSGLVLSPQLDSSRQKVPARTSCAFAALDPAVPNQPDIPDFQWPSIRVGRKNMNVGGYGEADREVKASAKDKWHKANESALTGDTPLSLPMTYPGTKADTKEEREAMLSCNPELEVRTPALFCLLCVASLATSKRAYQREREQV